MKNYKFLVPILLVLMFGGSFYMLNNTKLSEQKQYNEYLDTARFFYLEQGIRVDAEINYMKALDLNPSLDLYLEIGEFYQNTDQKRKALDWGERILSEYPKEARAYEFQMAIHYNNKDYVACFELANRYEKRKLKSAVMSDYIAAIEYEFFFNGEYMDVGIYSGGYCPVFDGEKWGYVNTTGGKSVASKFVKVGSFSGERAPVVDADGNAYFIDPDGEKRFVVMNVENVIELGFMENGIYSLYNGDTWSFYDQEYNYLFGGYQNVSAIGNGVAAVKWDGKWYLIDREGNDLTGSNYETVAMDEKLVVYRNERLFVSDGYNGYRMIDSSGNIYGDLTFQAVHIFNDTTYAAVMVDGKWGFVDASGQMVIEAQYEDARSFANGFAAVRIDGKWGFINTDGELVIEPQFENAKDFNDHGAVFVIRNGDWELLRLYKFNY